MEKSLLPMNLQFFARDPEAGTADPAAAAGTENAAADAAGTENGGSQDTTKKGATGKTYDQTYVDKIAADYGVKTAAAVEEALEVAKMDEAGKAPYEQKKVGEGIGWLSEGEAMAVENDKDHLSKLCEQRLCLYWQIGITDVLIRGIVFYSK